MKSHANPRKSKFTHQTTATYEKKDENQENEKEVEERLKSIKRRHTLIGKKNYDDHDLAKIDLNCLFYIIFFIKMRVSARWIEFRDEKEQSSKGKA